MTLWEQLGGRTWGERAGSQPDGPGPSRRRRNRRRKPAQLRRRSPIEPGDARRAH
jgi:hypothetical protein